MGRLLVDGPRPAVAWVQQLPIAWTTPRQRLLLLVLALDTYDEEPPFTCSPSTAELAQWCGVFKGRVLEDRDALRVTVPDVRPALLDVAIGKGRARTVYRLRTEVGPALWSGSADHYEPVSGPGERTTSSGPGERTTNTRSGPRCGPRSGPGSRTAPFPLPSSSPSVVTEPQVRAREMTTDDLNRIRDKLGDQPGLPTSDDRWLVSVAVDVLGAAGSPVQDPAAYVARAIRNDPGRYRRTPKPDPVAEVLARSNGAGACEHGEPRGPDHCPLCRRRNR